jgi:hypothetical protein
MRATEVGKVDVIPDSNQARAHAYLMSTEILAWKMIDKNLEIYQLKPCFTTLRFHRSNKYANDEENIIKPVIVELLLL